MMIMNTLLLLLMLLVPSVTYSANVTAVLGGNVVCDPSLITCGAFPTVVSSVCTAGCPLMSQPSFTDANRIWGNSTGSQCRTSTNGGSTWADCLTQPFASVGRESYAGASDGSVLGTSTVGANCSIARSTDLGANWGVVYTKVAETCGGAVFEQTELKCTSNGGCTFAYTAASTLVIVQSSNNGQSWAETFRLGASTIDVRSFSLSVAGAAIPAISTPFRGGTAVGTGWTLTSAYPAGANNCNGGFLLGSQGWASCWIGPGGLYQIRNADTGALQFTANLAGAVNGAATGGVMYGLGQNLVYAFAAFVPPAGNAPVGVWLSFDNGATFIALGQGSALANSMRGGDVWQHPLNGCLYASVGINPQLIKVC